MNKAIPFKLGAKRIIEKIFLTLRRRAEAKETSRIRILLSNPIFSVYIDRLLDCRCFL